MTVRMKMILCVERKIYVSKNNKGHSEDNVKKKQRNSEGKQSGFISEEVSYIRLAMYPNKAMLKEQNLVC